MGLPTIDINSASSRQDLLTANWESGVLNFSEAHPSANFDPETGTLKLHRSDADPTQERRLEAMNRDAMDFAQKIMMGRASPPSDYNLVLKMQNAILDVLIDTHPSREEINEYIGRQRSKADESLLHSPETRLNSLEDMVNDLGNVVEDNEAQRIKDNREFRYKVFLLEKDISLLRDQLGLRNMLTKQD